MTARYGLLALLALLAGIYLSCDRGKDPEPPQAPPPAPQLFTVTGTTDNAANLNWYSPTDEEDGFYLYIRTTATWSRYDTFPASASANVYQTATGLEPGSTYNFRVTAFNQNGESDSSNEHEAHTTGTLPPEPPTNVQATPLGANDVQVTWTPVGTQDGFRIERREPQTNWISSGTVGGGATSFTDTIAAPLTTYYYRVGSYRSNVVSWCLDSAVVTTPDGIPLAPDSLILWSLPGVGVRLTWADRSNNEIGFHISRNHTGQQFVTIDSVAANTTVYFDTLVDSTANYNWRVRSYNAYGASAWTTPEPLQYDLCSDGVYPLCRDNWWQYLVTDTAAADYEIRRNVARIDYPGGLDWYMITTSTWSPQGPVDTLYYLRNLYDGCYQMDIPPGSDPTLDQLYKWPATVGQFYHADGDCVLVAGAGQNIDVQGHLYENVYIYQRFYTPTYSIQVYIEPLTVGIIREEEYIGANIVVRRDLTNYFVQND